MLVACNMQLGVCEFRGTQYHSEIVLLAMQAYGHLIRSVSLTRYSFKEFADTIANAYDQENPQNKEVVRVLEEVHLLNTPVPQ